MFRGIILLLLLGVRWDLTHCYVGTGKSDTHSMKMKFSALGSAISVPVGSIFSVTCLDEIEEIELYSPTYTWTFTSENEGDIQMNLTEAELAFNPVGLQHSGQYTCVAKGDSAEGMVKVKRRFTLVVQEIPALVKWWLVIAKEGTTVKLPCSPHLKTVANTTYANAKWSKGQKKYEELKPIVPGTEKGHKKEATRIFWASNAEERDWSIEITNVKPEDGDLYYCGVNVGSEKIKLQVELLVEPAPPPRCTNMQPWEECPDPESMSWKSIVSESIIEFSVHLYTKLRGTHHSQNLLVSPISVAGLLSHLLLGAKEETRTELEKALSLPTEFSCLHSEMMKMREETNESMLMANQIYYNSRHTLGEAFVNQSLVFYDTVPEKLSNNSEENVKMINAWVARKTQNKITELVESVDSAELILLNAAYFIGKWKGLFEEKSKDGEFMTLSGEVVSVPILYSSKYNLATIYMPKLKAQVAKFPLTGKSSLYVMVPNSGSERALTLLEDNLNDHTLKAMVKELDSTIPAATEVTLPKIKLTMNIDLAGLLKKMGLFGLFDSPNLCGIFPGEEPVELNEGRHRVFLSLTERGVEAAAASSVSFSRSFNTFSAMQPFVFVIWSEQTACPLFMGRVIHPTGKE